jgi:hypothetical protein
MDSNEKILNEISTVVESLTLKLATLQDKVNELCKSTDCKRVKNVNKDLLCKKGAKTKRKTQE